MKNLKNINKHITNYSLFQIVSFAIVKFIRGVKYKFFFKKSRLPIWVGKSVSITHSQLISIGKNVKFESYSEIQGLSSDGIVLGDNVTIGRYSMIRPSSYYGVGNIGRGIKVGDNSSIGPSCFIGCSGKVAIGKNVMIGPGVKLFAENHNFKDTKKTIKSQGVNNLGIVIKDNCWIGSGTIILDGVLIGENSVIGAGSLIARDVEAGSVIIDKRTRIRKQRY